MNVWRLHVTPSLHNCPATRRGCGHPFFTPSHRFRAGYIRKKRAARRILQETLDRQPRSWQDAMHACISELLRTTHHPSSLLLRVERVVQQTVEAEVHPGQATRLYLTDDELVIQGLSAPSLRLEVDVGDVLDIRRFEVRKAPRTSRGGYILYLAIQDCDLLPQGSRSEDNESEGGGFLRQLSPSSTSPGPSNRKRRYSEMAEATSSTQLPAPPDHNKSTADFQKIHQHTKQSAIQDQPSSQSSSSDFETTTPNAAATQQRRNALHQLHASTSPYFDHSTSISTPKPTRPSRFTLTDDSPPTPSPPSSQPFTRPSPPKRTQPSCAINITPLATLPLLAPSTPTTILAIITWTSQSLIRPSPAFPPKRHVKLHDLSLSSVFTGVTLANFIDAANFKPARGTVVLLRGVVVQRCGVGVGGGGAGKKDGESHGDLAEVSRNYMLNAYANLPGKLRELDKEAKNSGGADPVEGGVEVGGSEEEERTRELGWYVDDEDTLMSLGLGEEVQALKDWWEEREARRTGGQSSAAGGG